MGKADLKKFVFEEFGFVEKEFGLARLYSKQIEGGFEFAYRNATTAVCLTYEFREAYLFVMLYRLVNGEFVKNPTRVALDTPLNGYALDDIVSLHNPDALVKPAYQYGERAEFYTNKEGLRLYFRLFAENLRKYGARVMMGNFEDFEGADKIVRSRIAGPRP